jgi:hypothetical protein
MSVSDIYNSLLNNQPKLAKIILESEERYVCFALDENTLLSNFVKARFPDVTHAHMESLQSDGEFVINIMFFDKDGEHIAGCEMTKDKVYWDDEE